MRRCALIVFLCILYHAACAQSPLEQRDSISEVVISTPINPALEMIRKAAEQREHHSIHANESFEYLKYQKVNARTDTVDQDLFLNESVSIIRFLRPNKENSKIIASKTAGFQNPLFSVWLASLEESYFDKDEIVLLTTEYLNPLSFKGMHVYDYHYLGQTTLDEDTFLHITFQPKPNHQFSSLQGELWLHHNDFALQEITAVAFDSTYRFPITIDYRFSHLENGIWVPDEFFTKVRCTFNIMPQLPPIDFYCRTAFQQYDLHPTLRPKDLNYTDIKDELSDAETNEQLLIKYRHEPISAAEIRTYHLIDSISRAAKLDRSLDLVNSLAQGMLPIGPIDISLADLIDHREIEGWRLGLGLYTSDRLCKRLTAGGHFAYGFADKQWKYGGLLHAILYPKLDMSLSVQYAHDLFESGTVSHNSNANVFLSADYIRQWLVNNYDYGDKGSITYQIRPVKWMTLQAHVSYGQFRTGYDYQFQQPERFAEGSRYTFTNFETRWMLRFAFKEKELKSGTLRMAYESPSPIITFHYSKGFAGVWGSQLDYHKFSLNIQYIKKYRNTGYTAVSLWGGYTPNDLPASLLYSPIAAYALVDFDSWEQFATMHSNAFLCDKYAFLFLRHNFGKLFENKKFSPQIILCHNMAIGGLSHPQSHQLIHFQDLRKGYFESGIIIDHLVDILHMCSLGVGVFYHYGPYYEPRIWDNLAIKIRFSLY